MRKALKHPAKRKGTEYDGPTINDKPALSVNDVQQWFRDVQCLTPSPAEAASIAAMINHCDLFSAAWISTSEFETRRQKNPSMLRMWRIAAALRKLRDDLPRLIGDSRRISPTNPCDGLVTLVVL
jgi:hypothetical protein